MRSMTGSYFNGPAFFLKEGRPSWTPKSFVGAPYFPGGFVARKWYPGWGD